MLANVRTIPAFPKPGDRVLFVASVLNRGTGSTPAGRALRVSFRVADEIVAWSPDLHETIPAGGMALVCGSEGPAGKAGCIAVPQAISVQAQVDVLEAIPEASELNNCRTLSWSASTP